MPILSLDYGEKRVGVAVSDPENRVALKRETIVYHNQEKLMQALGRICREEKIERIVIGLPVSLSGKDSRQTKTVRDFAEYVKMKLNQDVVLEDERLTSKEAENSGASDLDSESARLILQTYLDKKSIDVIPDLIGDPD
ncbi:Holliday junction resolvase RuvX [bacterium (Candidatus Torokbacteria) CG09_land_8_20_14_0_10_42_11]|nr:MAG: Holliday junction resolvase RuvX [bacterium (Candidatus Torokbacteria) CG09_land_8_20_14_0_10_42_11]